MDLEVFTPTPREVSAGGKTVEIWPLRIRMVSEFSRLVGPVLPSIVAGDYLGAIGAHGEAMIDAVSLATGCQKAWVGDLYPDAFLRLAEAVFEVNLDFFARQVLPQVHATSTAIAAKMTELSGQPASHGSSSEGTGPATS